MLQVAGRTITSTGLGLMRLTMPPFALPDAQIFPVLHAAVNAGSTLWSAADFYGTPQANSLHFLSRYFAAYPSDADKVCLTVKTGLVDRATMKMDCSPSFLRGSLDRALQALGEKKGVDVFGIARVDPEVPVEESVKALDELRKEGKCGGIMLSEVRASTIERACKVAKVDVVESEASVWSPEVFQNGVVETCAKHGVVLAAHSPLGQGMLSGKYKTFGDLEAPLKRMPRYQEAVFEANAKLVRGMEELAEKKGCSTPQLALSWVRSWSKKDGMPGIVTVAGARSLDRVQENALEVDLTEDDLALIEDMQKRFPVEGYRTMEMMKERNEY